MDMNYVENVTLSNKDFVAQEVLYHHLVRSRMPALEKLKRGLKTLDLLELLQADPGYFETWLTPSGNLSCDTLCSMFEGSLVERLDEGHLTEDEHICMGHMGQFLNELKEAQEDQTGSRSTFPAEMYEKEFPEKMLHFVCAIWSVPADRTLNLNIEFLEDQGPDDLPESSTCGNTLRLPTGLSYVEFRRRLVTAITFGHLGTDQF